MTHFAAALRARTVAVAKCEPSQFLWVWFSQCCVSPDRLDAWQQSHEDTAHILLSPRDATDDCWGLCIAYAWLGSGFWVEIGITDAAFSAIIRTAKLREAFVSSLNVGLSVTNCLKGTLILAERGCS